MTDETSKETSSTNADDIDVLEGAISFSDLLASCYGPTGLKRMIVNEDGVVVTSDLHRLLDETRIDHPVARIIAAGAVEQKEAVGDGSLAVALLVGALADRNQRLLERGFNRATIAEGFATAGQIATERLDEYTKDLDPAITAAVEGVARGALASATAETQSNVLSSIVEAARLIHEVKQSDGGLHAGEVEFRHVPSAGSRVELVRGTVIEKSPLSDTTPRELYDIGVAVIGGGRKAGSGIEERTLKRQGGEPGEGRTDVTFTPETPEQITAFRDAEVDEVNEQINALVEVGTEVVFCTMGISDSARNRLEAEGIPAFRGLTGDQSRRIARAIGARVVMNVSDIDTSDLGHVGHFEVVEYDDRSYVRMEDCHLGRVATLVLSGSVGESIEEVERDLRAAIVSTLEVLEDNSVVPGGGTIEVALASEIRDVARGIPDKTALVMDAYADALEDLPRTLARNAGIDPMDVLPALRARIGETTFDALQGDVLSVTSESPHTPVRVVRSTLETATEIAVQFARIDDVLDASTEEAGDVTDYDFRPKPGRDEPH